MTGRLIAVEGIAGSGKTAVSSALAGNLRNRGLDVLETKEPGGMPEPTAYGRLLRKFLLESHRDAMTQTLGFELDRALTSLNLIDPALAHGTWVVADRYYFGTIAYQVYGHHVELATVDQLTDAALGGRYPDLSLVLDASPDVALDRVAKRSRPANVFDREPAEYHERVRQGFLFAASRVGERARILDATRPLDTVIANAITAVEALMEAV